MDFIIPFIIESVFQLVTWVIIGLAIGGIWYYVGKDNWRGVLWSCCLLICAAVVMIAIVLQNHLAVFAAKTEPQSARPAPEPSGPRACLVVKNAKIIEGSLQSPESGIVTAVNAERNTIVLKPGMFIAMEVAIENVGDVTAKDVRPLYIGGVGDTLPPDNPDYQEGVLISKIQSVQELPKGGVFYIPTTVYQLTGEDVAGINEGRMFLNVYGYVTYRDTADRKLRYHYIYSPGAFRMVAGPNHNEIDCDGQKD